MTFEAIFLRETEKALLVDVEGEELWVPWSQVDCEESSFQPGCATEGSVKEGDVGRLVLSQWIAREKGLV
jgi:hypothetical protein